MMTIKFRTKLKDVDGRPAVFVPELKRSHCDMPAFRKSRRFGGYANSGLFLGLLHRTVKELGLPKWFFVDECPAFVTVDDSGFLATVTFEVPDAPRN